MRGGPGRLCENPTFPETNFMGCGFPCVENLNSILGAPVRPATIVVSR
jgi:hypothetical protein